MEKAENPVIFQHLSDFAHRHFSLRVGKVPIFKNPARRPPKTKESGDDSPSRGPNKKSQIKTSKNAILFSTGLPRFPILVVDPSAFLENTKKLKEVGSFFRVRLV